MINHVEKILHSIIAGNKETSFDRSEIPPGAGVIYGIKEVLSPYLEIIEFRMIFMTPEDFSPLPYMDNGQLKFAPNNMAVRLTSNIENKTLVLFDEYEHAHPQVKDEIEKIIVKAKQNGAHIHFVKLG